jgi:hypothetical protein
MWLFLNNENKFNLPTATWFVGFFDEGVRFNGAPVIVFHGHL